MRQQAMKSGFAFSGNPVIFSEPTEPGEVTGGSFDLMLGGRPIYSCKFSLPLYSLNLSEVIDGELEPIPLPDLKEGEFLSRVSDLASRSIQIIGEYDNGAECESGLITMVRGRIPSALYRQLTTAGKDIFNERFLNPEANFFLTTRTAGDLIEIPETEIYPLCFILPKKRELIVTTPFGNHRSGELSEGIYWLDFDALRRRVFMKSSGSLLPNAFNVGFVDSQKKIKIVITRSEISLDRVRLRYRNSFDIPEVMAFTGKLTVKQSKEESQDNEYLSYLPISDDFRIDREESRLKIELTLDTGPIEPRDLPRLMEVVNSSDVALESPADGSWIPVVVSGGDISFPLRPETPESFEITLKISEDDLSVLEALNPDDMPPLRLFTDEYNDKFS